MTRARRTQDAEAAPPEATTTAQDADTDKSADQNDQAETITPPRPTVYIA
jgi:hypothetical protein